MGFSSPLPVTLENKMEQWKLYLPKLKKFRKKNGTNWVIGWNEMVQSGRKEEISTGRETRKKKKEASPAKDWKFRLRWHWDPCRKLGEREVRVWKERQVAESRGE